MDLVSQHSRRAYEELVRTPGFFDFFREGTPIDVIETSGIGSRPARRTGQQTLEALRAIPWVFAWAQSRFALTGWNGFGAGFSALAQHDPASCCRGGARGAARTRDFGSRCSAPSTPSRRGCARRGSGYPAPRALRRSASVTIIVIASIGDDAKPACS